MAEAVPIDFTNLQADLDLNSFLRIKFHDMLVAEDAGEYDQESPLSHTIYQAMAPRVIENRYTTVRTQLAEN